MNSVIKDWLTSFTSTATTNQLYLLGLEKDSTHSGIKLVRGCILSIGDASTKLNEEGTYQLNIDLDPV